MGVMGLMRFMNKCKYYNVQETNLKQLADDHRNAINERPLLVIDGLSVVGLMYPESEHWVYGGQMKQFAQSVKHFVQQVEQLEIDMVFYFNGNIGVYRTPDVKRRRRKELETLRDAFYQIRNGNFSNEKRTNLPPIMSSFVRYVLKYECEVTVINTIENIQQEISRFARDNPRCFGILADDTDYVIFDTKPLIASWSLDKDTMNIKLYSRDELAKALKLQPQQLPILSCMLGNEIIPCHLLRNFHYYLSPNYGSNYNFLAAEMSRIIRRFKWNGESRDITLYSESLEIHRKKLEEGLAWYDIQTPVNHNENSDICSPEVVELLRNRCIETLVPFSLYSMLCHRRYYEDSSLEDPKNEGLPPSALIYRSMRRRMYGVFFGEKTTNVQEWCIYYSKRDIRIPETVSGLEFEFTGKVPNIDVLWSEDTSRDIHWDVFVACLGVTISVTELKKLEAHLVAICCILNHLMHFRGVELPEWEVKAFISQAVHPRANDLDYISSLQVPEIRSRAVSLAGIFLRGVTNVMILQGACGLPFPLMETMPWKYFDGKLFHHCYNRLLEKPNYNDTIMELYENDKDAMDRFFNLYSVATQGVARMNYSSKELPDALNDC